MLCTGVVLRLAGFLLVSGLIHVAKSYPFGAGLSACKTLIPGHGKEPQPMETLPFMIEPESDYFTVGKIFKVRIRTASGRFKHRKIGGFFVQARAPGTTDPVGRWEVHHEESVKYGMKGQNCSYPFDSITHSDSKPKNADLVIHFMPTANTPDQIQFMGTIARDYGTFWANVKSGIVTKRVVPQLEEERWETITTTTTAATFTPFAKHHKHHEPEYTTVAAAAPASHSPKRIHHVTQHMVDHTITHRPPHRATHHQRRTTTIRTTTTTSPAPAEIPKITHYAKLDPDEKYLDGEDLSSLLSKNELEALKARGGHRDDETDRVQNDGSTNPDSMSVKQGRSSANAAATQQHVTTFAKLITGLLSQLTFFITCWLLC